MSEGRPLQAVVHRLGPVAPSRSQRAARSRRVARPRVGLWCNRPVGRHQWRRAVSARPRRAVRCRVADSRRVARVPWCAAVGRGEPSVLAPGQPTAPGATHPSTISGATCDSVETFCTGSSTMLVRPSCRGPLSCLQRLLETPVTATRNARGSLRAIAGTLRPDTAALRATSASTAARRRRTARADRSASAAIRSGIASSAAAGRTPIAARAYSASPRSRRAASVPGFTSARRRLTNV
jgi:hypothetical protein